MGNCLDDLDRWKNGHKARDVTITHDNGCGGSAGWEVTLRGEGGRVVAVSGYREPEGWLSLEAVIRCALQTWEGPPCVA